MACELAILHSTLLSNTAESGGAVFFDSGSLLVQDSNIVANEVERAGGGIYTAFAEATVIGSVLCGNRVTNAYGQGGGIWNLDGTLTVVNSTVAANGGTERGTVGGGIDSAGTVILFNTLIAGNDAASDPDVQLTVIYDHTISGSHNLIGDGSRPNGPRPRRSTVISWGLAEESDRSADSSAQSLRRR